MKDKKVISQSEFHIVDLLGEGSTGIVYKALKTDPSKSIKVEVALKVFSSEEQVKVWQREFASLSKVSSPYCVKVHGFERVMGKPALTLELVEGLTLHELLDVQALNEDHVLEIASQILLGLKDLWSCGMCHGDLSPNNVMVAKNGQVKLLDFGLGNFDELGSRGTPFFMQDSLKQGGVPNPSTDLFALGRLMNWSGQRLTQASQQLHELGSKISDSSEAQDRVLDRLEKSVSAQESLSEIVADRLAVKTQSRAETQEFLVKSEQNDYGVPKDEDSKLSSASRSSRSIALRIFFAVFVAVSLAGLVSMYLGRELSSQQQTLKKAESARVEIRTQSWKEIWLDGKRKGYTPAILNDVPAGEHLLKWASPEGSGEIILTLKPGENKLLTDEDLSPKGE